MDLVFATKNINKMAEIREILNGSGFNALSLSDLELEADIVEDADSFEGNALKKARGIAEITGKLTLADDSGLEIDFLNGAPGVYSARYMGEDTPYDIKNTRILELLKGVPPSGRGARFVCVIAAAFPGGAGIETIFERGVIEGRIHDKISGGGGFGYDPIFFVEEYGMTTAQMPTELKNSISHRGKALKQMKERLPGFVGKQVFNREQSL